MTRLLLAASLVAISFASPAVAAVFTGDTTGGQTYNRPLSGIPPVSLSGVGTAVRFVVTPFTVTASGGYDFLNSTGYDSYLGVHRDSFNPLTPLVNAVGYSDDFNGLNGGFSGLGLLTGVNYFAVSSGFDNTDFGAFTLTITGPGNVIGGSTTGAVPEPASWALLIAGFGLTGAAMRRRRQVAATA